MLTRTRTIITCTAAAAAAGLAASIAAPAPATARLAPSIVAGPYGAPRPASNNQAIGVSAAPASNRYFAGYQAPVPAGSATVATATFTVPALSCTVTTFPRAIGPVAGVDENNFKTYSSAFLFTGCVNGQAVNYPALVVNGTFTPYPATLFAAGDVIDLTTKVSTNRTRVQVTDVTTGVTQKILGPGARADDGYFGDSPWFTGTGTLLHVPGFGKLQFKNCLVDGKALASWRPRAYQRVNSNGTVQISTGGFWPGGTAFTTRYMHS